MGLLDVMLGAANQVAASHQKHPDGGLAQVLGGLAGHSGLGGLAAIAASNPQVVKAVVSLLSNDGPVGGLSGLISHFNQAGLGGLLASWVGPGANQSITGDQMQQVLGSDVMSQLAGNMGTDSHDAAHHIAAVLPNLLDHLTPHGQPPKDGLGNASDLSGILGRLLHA